MIDLRLAVPALTAWVSAGVAISLPGGTELVRSVATVLWSVAAVAAAAAILLRLHGHATPPGTAGRCGSRAVAITAAVCVAAAAGALAVSAAVAALPSRHPEAVARLAHHTVELRATVSSVPQKSTTSTGRVATDTSAGVRFTATVKSVTAGASSVSARMPVLVFAPTASARGASPPTIGETVSVKGTVTMLPPGSETAALVYASSPPRVVAAAPWPLAAANGMRAAFARQASALPGDGGALLPGLAIGDVHELPASLSDAMKASSLTHLTAVSGANCAVVVSLVGAAAGAIGLGRGARAAASLTALAGFVVLVTPQPSVLRAAVMASVIVFGGWAGRPGRAIPALALAIVVLVTIDPWLAVDFGFALSVLATGALLLLAPPMTERLSRWMPGRVAALLAVPAAAQVACQPVLLLLNPTVPIYGVLANLVAEPAAPIATVLGLIACLLAPVWAPCGALLAAIAWVPSAWIAAVARVSAALPGSALGWAGGALGFCLMVALCVAIVVVVARPSRVPTRVARTATLVATGGFVLCSLAAVLGGQLALAVNRPANWSIAACDIGQGDAVLVQSHGAHALVDVGPEPARLSACLSKLGIDHIDLLVLTHYDLDHVGGAQAVVGKVSIALVGPPDRDWAYRLDDSLTAGGADVHVASAGDAGRLGDLAWRVLWPDADGDGMEPGNESSVVMLFDGDGIRSLFLGDMDERSQTALLDTGRVPPVDVVKVGHHGSADQAEALYQHIEASVGVISAGLGNDYGHPTSAALGILSRAGTTVLRTDVEGMSLIASDGRGGLRLWTERRATSEQLRTPGRGLDPGG